MLTSMGLCPRGYDHHDCMKAQQVRLTPSYCTWVINVKRRRGAGGSVTPRNSLVPFGDEMVSRACDERVPRHCEQPRSDRESSAFSILMGAKSHYWRFCGRNSFINKRINFFLSSQMPAIMLPTIRSRTTHALMQCVTRWRFREEGFSSAWVTYFCSPRSHEHS
jgi:hypothetical protein